MRPLIVTAANGEKRRLNPMQIIGWKEGDIPAEIPGEPTKVYAGTVLALSNGVAGVRESVDQIDRLFVEATGDWSLEALEALHGKPA